MSLSDETLVSHLDAAYNLARWLTRDGDDAEDVVQDACMRALRYVGTLRTGGARPWFLTIVRNTFYDWVARNRPVEIAADRADAIDDATDLDALSPEQEAVRRGDAQLLSDALQALPLQFREAIVLRELEELSYRDMAHVLGVPIGTVMSRLARGRAMLRRMPSLQPVHDVVQTRRQS